MRAGETCRSIANGNLRKSGNYLVADFFGRVENLFRGEIVQTAPATGSIEVVRDRRPAL